MQPWSKAIFSEGIFVQHRFQGPKHMFMAALPASSSIIFQKIIEKSTNRQLIKSPLGWGGDGNGNLTKLSRSRWFNIYGSSSSERISPPLTMMEARTYSFWNSHAHLARFRPWIYMDLYMLKNQEIYTSWQKQTWRVSILKINTSFRSFNLKFLILISIIQSYKT